MTDRRRASASDPLEHVGRIVGRIMPAVMADAPAASCAECGERRAQRMSLFCQPCAARIERTADLYGEVVL